MKGNDVEVTEGNASQEKSKLHTVSAGMREEVPGQNF